MGAVKDRSRPPRDGAKVYNGCAPSCAPKHTFAFRYDNHRLAAITPPSAPATTRTDRPMEYAPKPGCPMCGIISTATHGSTNSPRAPSFPAGSTQPEVVWRDDNFTVYREKAYPVSSKGHLVVAFKCVLHR